MPIHPFLNAFTTGEITDQLIARTTWDKYQNAAACLKNFVVRPYGGAARRAGLMYLGAVKDPSSRVRLVKFEFGRTQAYMLEFGQEYIRVWANRAPVMSGGVQVEMPSPYTVAELRELRFEQSADVLYIAHPNHPPAKLQRTSATAFQLDDINFNPQPTFEQEILPDATLTMTSAAISVGVVFTASAGAWLAGDVGRLIISGVGRAVITAFTSTTQVTATILDAFDSTGPIPAGEWALHGSPNAGTLLISSNGPVNSPASFTSSLDAFRVEDVGKSIYAAGGIAQIYEVPSALVANALIVKTLTGTPPITVLAGGWTLESPVWSDELGYPGVVALFGQRLWWAGSPDFPDRLWGSTIADYESHARGVEDDDALDFPLASSGVNMIRWLKGLPDGLGIGTLAGELTLDGGSQNAAITPTSVNAQERTHYGCDYTVDAIRTTNLVLFLQRGALRIRELTTDATSVDSRYVAPDLSLLAEQLTRSGLVEIDKASSPDSLVFAITNEGVFLSCAYERPEGIVGWSHHETQGDFESLAVIPNNCGTGDEVWVSVNRSIPGGQWWNANWWHANWWNTNWWALAATVDRRSVEVFDGAFNTDAALSYTGVAASTFGGLGHLEGLPVLAITEDGTVHALIVNEGAITLPDEATTTELEVGLEYTSTLQTLRPELQGPQGTAQGRRKRWQTVTLRVYCTRGRILLNGVSVLEYPEHWDTTLNLDYTGDMARIPDFGWSREGQLTFQTTEPKPCTILAATGQLEMDDA